MNINRRNKFNKSKIDKKVEFNLPVDVVSDLRLKYLQIVKENKKKERESKEIKTEDIGLLDDKDDFSEQQGIHDDPELSLSPFFEEKVQDCSQAINVALNISQNILEKTLSILIKICPSLNLGYNLEKALQILKREVIATELRNVTIYKQLFEIFEEKSKEDFVENINQNSWQDIAERLGSDTSPCRIFYFVFRLLAILLRCIKQKIEHKKKSTLAIAFLKNLETSSLFLNPASKICNLKAIFQFCRKNPLPVQATCLSQYRKIHEFSGDSGDMSTDQIAAAEQSSSIFSGDLSYISIWQILQMLGMEQKEGCLNLIFEDGTTKIYLQNGTVLHAISELSEGLDAFYNVLKQKEGKFTFDMKETTVKTTINQPIEFLLMEGARIMDEQSRE